MEKRGSQLQYYPLSRVTPLVLLENQGSLSCQTTLLLLRTGYFLRVKEHWTAPWQITAVGYSLLYTDAQQDEEQYG